jgi:hypothetical protein
MEQNKKENQPREKELVPGGGDGHCDMSAVAEIVLYGDALCAHP